MRTLKRQNEADEKGDQEDDWNGIVTRPHHLVKGVPPFQLSTLEGCNEGPVDRLRGYLVEAGKIAVQPIRIAADVSENVSHGKHVLEVNFADHTSALPARRFRPQGPA